MPEWTPAQKDAIEALKGTVLVSAAAGSGKTAVLVERVIRRITDSENPIDADKFLIVTFTKASAGEMKERIENAILEKLRLDPLNKRLSRQQILLSEANICTVDSFCAKVAREFFERLNISRNFTVLTGKQEEQMKSDALQEAIGEMYESGNTTAADLLSSDRNDKRLSEAVMRLYNFTRSNLFPDEWLKEKLKDYNTDIPLFDTVWGKIVKDYIVKNLSFIKSLINEAYKLSLEDSVLKEKFSSMFASDMALAENIEEALKINDFDTVMASFDKASFARFPTVKGYSENSLKIRIQELRETVKETVKKLSSYFYDTEENIKDDIKRTVPYAQALYNLTLRFTEIYEENKLNKNMADYSDIEHYAVKLFIEKDENGNLKRTELAKDYSDRFEEIMIDEYQDTNDVQDAIFKAISKNDSNRFMVGDVKQSIYSFREAKPEIFISYKNAFSEYDRELENYPAVIDLDRNFRSDKNVIDTVNFFFSELMSEAFGGVNYKNGEELAQGVEKAPKENCETEIIFVNEPEFITNEQAEARIIAEKITELINSGYKVKEKDKERKASYKDFCILLRSANKHAFSYAEELNKCGVAAKAAVGSSFFNKEEVLTAISYLEIIDNPNQDIPLLSVLLSPLYGFTPDDLARIRLNDRQSSIYVALMKSEDERFKEVFTELERMRTLAATMSAGEFISYFYSVTGFENIVKVLDGGQERLMNLRRLKELASDFERDSFVGVSGFVRFIEKLIKQGAELESAASLPENSDSVKIMSIHKSKGLEFPVCIVAGCGRRFNFDRSDIVLNSELGLGVSLKNQETGIKYQGFIKEAIELNNRMKEASEELRVFYVALTRAKDKLILVSTLSDIEKSLAKVHARISSDNGSFAAEAADRISDWIMLAALKHPSGKNLRKLINAEEQSINFENFSEWKIEIKEADGEREEVKEVSTAQAEPNDKLIEKLREKCDFVYPYKEINTIPSKVTATQLTNEFKNISLPRPGFLSYKGLTPAERGIALHSFMQFASFNKEPEAELERLIKEGYITKEQGESINLNLVRKFLFSPLGKRMLKAEDIKKEYRFSVNIEAGIVREDLTEENKHHPVILQGAIDCYFLENGKMYIVDFKTDRVKDLSELVLEYGTQLKLYAKALKEISDYPLGGCYIFSLHLSESVEIEL